MVAAIDHPDIRESESHIMVSPESAFDYGRASRARNYHEDPSEIDARPGCTRQATLVMSPHTNPASSRATGSIEAASESGLFDLGSVSKS